MATFFSSHILWAPSNDLPPPSSAQLPFFIFLAIIESLLFGIGIIYVIFAWPKIKQGTIRNKLTFFSIAWLLLSWWPHDNFHMSNGMNLRGLLYIEYGFHFTLILASLIVMYAFISFLNEQNQKNNIFPPK